MATYYIRPDGSNTNAGTGPGVGSAWQTIGKALASGSPVVGGDTVYVSPGTYREGVTVGIAPSSNVNVTADPKALQFPGMAQGLVIWSAHTAGDDAASTVTPCNLGSASNFTFTDFVVHGHNASANGNCFHSASMSQNITWNRCVLHAKVSSCIRVTGTTLVPLNWTIANCVFVTDGSCLAILPTESVGGVGNVNMNVVVTNCVFYGYNNACIAFQPTVGTGSFAGGMTIYNCSFYSGSYGVYCNPAGMLTTAFKVVVRNCWFDSQSTNSVREALTNFIDENYNRFAYSTRSVATSGANSIAAGIRGTENSAGWTQGISKYVPLAPSTVGILDGDGTSTGAPASDILGNTRPSPPSVGAFERVQISAGAGGALLVNPGINGGING